MTKSGSDHLDANDNKEPNSLHELEVKIASALLCQIRLNHNNHSQLIPR